MASIGDILWSQGADDDNTQRQRNRRHFMEKMRDDPRAQARNQERLVDSIIGSLRVEGYTVDKGEVRRRVQAEIQAQDT